MGEMGEYWRDVKAHYRKKQKRYENKISPTLNKLINHPECKKVGDHWRIGDWDFWYTGTVMNPRTKEYSSIKQLAESLN